MQHDWFMYHLRSKYKNRLEFSFIKDHRVDLQVFYHFIFILLLFFFGGGGGGDTCTLLSQFPLLKEIPA